MRMIGDEYKRAFGLPGNATVEPGKALKVALDIRKFEIGLYWQRATYFWAFLALAVGGYFTLLVSKDPTRAEKGEGLLTISCLGIVFSVAWYCVNRASKFWQENWEKHVDLLEDAEVGPIYKTVLHDDDLRFWDLSGPYPFSVSKVNQLLSLFVVLLFALLAVTTLCRYYSLGCPPDPFATSMVVLTVIAVWTLFSEGQTSPLGRESRVRAEQRQTKVV